LKLDFLFLYAIQIPTIESMKREKKMGGDLFDGVQEKNARKKSQYKGRIMERRKKVVTNDWLV
jgi:hypothetical protein